MNSFEYFASLDAEAKPSPKMSAMSCALVIASPLASCKMGLCRGVCLLEMHRILYHNCDEDVRLFIELVKLF